MKTEALVLHSLRYGDASRIVHIYTASVGMVAFMVRGGGGRGRGVQAALLQPLTLVEIDFDHRPNKNLQSLRDVQLLTPYASLPFDMRKRAIAMFLAEVLHPVLRGEPGNEALFAFVSSSLRWLDLAEERYANFHLIFLLQLTRHLGFYPEHHALAEAYHLPVLLRLNYRSMHLLRLTREQRSRFLDTLLDFYADNVPAFPEILSAEVLHEVLS